MARRRQEAGHGEAKQLREQTQGAPLAGAGGGGDQPAPQGAPSPQRGGLFDPTQRPGEPMTAGMPMGAGDEGPRIPELDDADYSPTDLVVRALLDTPGLEHLQSRLIRLLEG